MKPIRLLTAAAALSLAGGMLGMAAATAPAAAAATASGQAHASQILTASSVPLQSGTASDPFFVVNDNSGLCLGISGGRSDAPAVQWNCEAVANQEWHWGSELGSTGYFQLINGDGQCLGIGGGSTRAGAPAYGWTCNGHHDQYWFASGGVATDYNSQLVLGVAGGSTAVGAAVVQWPYTGAANQFWTAET
jgi:hypothetical protein